MTKKIIICADDFGMSENINEGILYLLENKVINATSCMPSMPAFTNGVRHLKKIHNSHIDIGLHLNITEGFSLTSPCSLTKNNIFLSLPKLLVKSEIRVIKYNDVYKELKAQLDKFIELWGSLPDFIDGHQHIHHFPIIRTAIINLYRDYNLYENNTYVRSTYNMNKSDVKSMIIYYSGAKKLNKLLIKNNIKHNTSFAGIYNLKSNNKYFRDAILMAYSEIQDGGLIMCHPSKAIDLNDPISKSRVNEFKYFKSEQAKVDQTNYCINIEK